jgi:hypothetical protein
LSENEDIDLTLFEPTMSDMVSEYPELANYQEFKDLKPRDIKVAWYIGNRTSPLYKSEKDLKKRIILAAKEVYNKRSRNRSEVKTMLKGELPEYLEAVVKKMTSFDITHRLRAKFMDEYVFNQLESLAQLSDADRKVMDTDDKKKYAELAIKISSEMPNLIARMESGYGLKNDKTVVKEGQILTSVGKMKDRLNEDK